MGKHTPGPWLICDGPMSYEHRIYAEPEPGDLTLICEVARHRDVRVLAAAPELLSAAEHSLMTLLCSCQPAGNPDVNDGAEIHAAVAILRDAIAKATGGA